MKWAADKKDSTDDLLGSTPNEGGKAAGVSCKSGKRVNDMPNVLGVQKLVHGWALPFRVRVHTNHIVSLHWDSYAFMSRRAHTQLCYNNAKR